MCASLLELLDHLHLVAGDVFLVEQVDVLDVPVIENEVVDVVIVDLAGLIDDAFARFVEIGFDESQPFAIRELHVVQGLQLRANVG